MGFLKMSASPCPLCRTTHTDLARMMQCIYECATKTQNAKYKIGFTFQSIFDARLQATLLGYEYCIIGIRVRLVNGKKTVYYVCSDILRNSSVEFTTDEIHQIATKDATKIRDAQASD